MGDVDARHHTFTAMALEEEEWLAILSAIFTPRNPGTHFLGGSVDPKACLDMNK